jgi:hypothetical protein
MEVGEVLEPLLAFLADDLPFAEVSRLAVVSKTWRRVYTAQQRNRSAGRVYTSASRFGPVSAGPVRASQISEQKTASAIRLLLVALMRVTNMTVMKVTAGLMA